jgi:hypothetical protein
MPARADEKRRKHGGAPKDARAADKGTSGFPYWRGRGQMRMLGL